jgi:hypothetical protein
MEIYCKHCGSLLEEGEVHVFNELFFCDYDCLESYVIGNTEIEYIQDYYKDYEEFEYCQEVL